MLDDDEEGMSRPPEEEDSGSDSGESIEEEDEDEAITARGRASHVLIFLLKILLKPHFKGAELATGAASSMVVDGQHTSRDLLAFMPDFLYGKEFTMRIFVCFTKLKCPVKARRSVT